MLDVGAVLCFVSSTYSTVDGGVPKSSKNDDLIPFSSMDDNGLIIGWE